MDNTRDIDDILREVEAEFSYKAPEHDGDLEALTNAWVAERSAPELLHWPQDGLIDRVNEKIQRQIEKVEEMTGDMDPSTNFSLIVIQTELERYKFLLRSYLRSRLSKLDKYTLHYLSTSQRSKLSPAEISFANRHQVLLYKHYMSSFLNAFPPHMRGINDTTVVSMVDQPDLDTAVFVRAKRECLVKGRGVRSDEKHEASAGEVLIARWSDVKQLVLEGDAELV